MKRLIELGFLACVAAAAAAHPVAQQKLSVIERADRLSTGQFVWEPEAALTGPVVLVIDLTRQHVLVYRGGVPIAASTISSGSKGRETPIGVFTILQKEVFHRSRTYDDAPMPYSVFYDGDYAVHGTHQVSRLGRPASAGCVRLAPGHAAAFFNLVREEGLGNTLIVIRQ